VSFVDRLHVHHSVDVQAATIFEAVCRAASIFKHSVVEDPTWAAEFFVEVMEKPNTYRRRIPYAIYLTFPATLYRLLVPAA
jgi:hypothetical protein